MSEAIYVDEVALLISWLRKRGQPDSGIDYRASNSWQDAFVRLSGTDADFIAKHFHGKGALRMAEALAALTSPPKAEAEAGEVVVWRSFVDEPPVAICVLARYFDPDAGEWVYNVVVPSRRMVVPSRRMRLWWRPYTQWLPLDTFDRSLYTTPELRVDVVRDLLRIAEDFNEEHGDPADTQHYGRAMIEAMRVAFPLLMRALSHPKAEAGEPEAAELLAKMAKHRSWELDWGPEDPNDEEGDFGWRVHERRGNRSDREWWLIGFGDTPLAALREAALNPGATNAR